MDILSPSSCFRNSTWLFEENRETKWTAEENKLFKNALTLYDQDTTDLWYYAAAMIPGKIVSDVIKQYSKLVEDVSDVEAGLIPVPGYCSDYFTLVCMNNQGFEGEKRSSSTRSSDQEKKGIPWTEEEHM